MSHELPSFLEDDISQIPALQLLQNLGWEYLTPQETVTLRAGKLSSVMLEGVLVPQLRKFNKIRFKGASTSSAKPTSSPRSRPCEKLSSTG